MKTEELQIIGSYYSDILSDINKLKGNIDDLQIANAKKNMLEDLMQDLGVVEADVYKEDYTDDYLGFELVSVDSRDAITFSVE